MATPEQAWERIKQLAHDQVSDSDVHLLATFCHDLEQAVIKPLRHQVVTLEHRVKALEAESVHTRTRTL